MLIIYVGPVGKQNKHTNAAGDFTLKFENDT